MLKISRESEINLINVLIDNDIISGKDLINIKKNSTEGNKSQIDAVFDLKLTDERKTIAKYIRESWNDLDAVIGGQISIDIYPKGNDKSQVLNVIEQERLVPPSEYIFIGDGIENGGNDYPLAELMDNTEICD